ncbi:MAG: sugar ABC transporter permease [Treponema sp.]|nr:sugar ABC transporter permease [Treponema sp.]
MDTAFHRPAHRHLGDQFYGFLLTTPGILLIVFFTVFPFILNIYVSFTGYTLINQNLSPVGLVNYRQVIKDGILWNTTLRTLIWTAGSFIPIFLLGVLCSLVMNSRIRGISILRALILLPWIMPEVVTGYNFQWMFSGDYGIVWTYLVKWGTISKDFTFFTSPAGALFAVILANVWRGFPFVAVMSYAKLKTIPAEQIEAAIIEGTNPLQRFVYITIPWLFPILKRCAFLVFVWNFNSFSIIYTMTKGGPGATTETFPVMIQRIAFRMLDFRQATTLGTFSALIVVVVLVAVYVMSMIIRKGRVRHT